MSLMSKHVSFCQRPITLAVLAFAVGGVERGRELIHFGAFLGVGGRREREPGFQEVQHAGGVGGNLNAVELFGLLGQADGLISRALAGGGGKRLGIVGDEVFLNPFGAAGFDAEIVEFHLRVVEKFLGVAGGGLGLGAAGEESENGWNSDTQDERSHRVMIPSSRDPISCRYPRCLLRGKSWTRIIAIALLVAPFLVAVWAFGIEPGMLVVRHLQMELPGWKSELRIAVLSDLHVGSPHVGLDKVRTIVEKTNAENPALIVLLGDFVIGGPNGGSSGMRGGGFVEPEETAAELKKLRAPLGVFAVLGNHDWWYDGERVGRALTAAGIQVLENRAVRVGPIWLGGIADYWTREPDVAGTLRQLRRTIRWC